MGTNEEISAIFYEIADILEFQGVDWKPIAYRRAAQSLEGLEISVSEVYKKGGIIALEKIPNIGENLAKKIVEYIQNGKIGEYDRLKASIPRKTAEIMRIPGIGAKRTKKLFSELKISSISQLKSAIEKHKVSEISGFGERSEKEMLEHIKNFEQSRGERYSFKLAQNEAAKIIKFLKKINGVKRIDVAGSLRRKKSTIGDIDILVLSKNPSKVVEAFISMKDLKDVLAKGQTRAAGVLNSGIQVDIRLIPEESYGAGLMYFTGNKNYNIYLRRIAIQKRYKLNEYGLFDRKTAKKVAGKTEKEIFKKLGLKYLKPEEREF